MLITLYPLKEKIRKCEIDAADFFIFCKRNRLDVPAELVENAKQVTVKEIKRITSTVHKGVHYTLVEFSFGLRNGDVKENFYWLAGDIQSFLKEHKGLTNCAKFFKAVHSFFESVIA